MRKRTKAILIALASAALIGAAAETMRTTPRLPPGANSSRDRRPRLRIHRSRHHTRRSHRAAPGERRIRAAPHAARSAGGGPDRDPVRRRDRGGGPPPEWADLVGGPNAIAPGSSAASIQHLHPGHYALLCFIPSSDRVPHFAKGMHRDLWVVGTPVRVTEPRPDIEIRLVDYAFAALRTTCRREADPQGAQRRPAAP